jgi:hypothetical protein
MKFLIFVLMVTGIVLLAVGKLNEDTQRQLVQTIDAHLEDTGEAVTDFVSEQIPETLVETVAERIIDTAPAEIIENDEVLVEQSTPQTQAPRISDLDEVLTHGIEYSERQLANPVASAPPKEPAGRPTEETMQQIHSLNREALSSLSRVDTVLHSKKKGSKQ